MSKHHTFSSRRVVISALAMAACSACAAADSARPLAAAAAGADVLANGAWRAASDYRPAWATALIGRHVVDSRTRHLGKLVDLVVELSTGRTRYAIVSDVHGPTERLVAVPAALIKETENATVFLAMDRERFARQKSWRPARWPTLDDSAFWREVDRLSGAPVTAADAREGYRLSRLVQSDVDNLQGQHLGRIIDVVIDMAAQEVHYAILGYDRGVGAATEHAFAVPITSLRVGRGGGRLALEVAHARLAGLIGSDPAAGKPIDGPRYLGTVDRTYQLLPPHGAVGATR